MYALDPFLASELWHSYIPASANVMFSNERLERPFVSFSSGFESFLHRSKLSSIVVVTFNVVDSPTLTVLVNVTGNIQAIEIVGKRRMIRKLLWKILINKETYFSKIGFDYSQHKSDFSTVYTTNVFVDVLRLLFFGHLFLLHLYWKHQWSLILFSIVATVRSYISIPKSVNSGIPVQTKGINCGKRFV